MVKMAKIECDEVSLATRGDFIRIFNGIFLFWKVLFVDNLAENSKIHLKIVALIQKRTKLAGNKKDER